MKWGLFGGTFNPIHLGHLRCAEEVREMFALDKVVFVPAALPPLKDAQDILPFHHREQMIKLSIRSNLSFSVTDVEHKREGKSYTIDTVRHFIDTFPDPTELYFVLGQDAFDDITQWKEWDTLLTLCHFVVMTRPGYRGKNLADIITDNFASRFTYDGETKGYRGPTGKSIFFRKLTFLDISASDIRNRVKQEQSIMFLVPDPVRHYILDNSLYRTT